MLGSLSMYLASTIVNMRAISWRGPRRRAGLGGLIVPLLLVLLLVGGAGCSRRVQPGSPPDLVPVDTTITTGEGLVRVAVELRARDGEPDILWPSQPTLLWSDGDTTPMSVVTDRFPPLVVIAERPDPPEGVYPRAVRFPVLAYSVGMYENARLTETAFETRWGNFPVTGIHEDNGTWLVRYEPVESYWIAGASVSGRTTSIQSRGSGGSIDEDTRTKTNSYLRFPTALGGLIREMPLRAELDVWGMVFDVQVTLPPR